MIVQSFGIAYLARSESHMTERRKLAAIFAADVVGFSRLMGADEEGTLTRLRTVLDHLVDPNITAHNGRVFKRTGDGVLVEFLSVVDAVRCAIDVQEAMIEHNGGLQEKHTLVLRIGIHLGDVIEQSDGDLMGDGVNIAARLEGIAKPGAVCLSEDAYRQVRAKINLSVTDHGETTLKNIAEPIRIYSLAVGNELTMKDVAAEQLGLQTNKATKLRTPEKPSIAVLPFTNMSGDNEQEYFVDGMVEDIITALSRFNQLFVIARNSSFVYKGRAVDIKEVGRELGVRYVLEGSVRKAGNRLRITGQLIDATSGAHLWADRFDGELEDVFDLQDRITDNVIGAIEPTVRKAEIERSRRKSAGNLDAYDLYLQALPNIYAVRPDENRKALDLLNRAIDLDPSYGPVFAHAAWCFVQRISRPWPPYGSDDLATAISMARRALAAETDDAVSIVLGGFTLVMLKQDYATGLDAVRRSVKLNPGSGFVNAMAGCALVFGDDLEAGLRLLERAMTLSPMDPNFFSHLTVSAVAHLFNDRADLAAELAERSLALNSEWDSTYWVLIAAYTQLDRLSEARVATKKLLTISSEATVAKYKIALPIRSPDSLELVLSALRRAGLPE